MNSKAYVGLAILVSIFFGISTVTAQRDTSFLQHATNSLQKWATENPKEKVYLHLDRSSYDLYDTVWYKAYTVVGVHHQLSVVSGVLYVELINANDSILTRQIIHLNTGVAWGDIPLPEDLKPGDYHIRAYTNWMRNAGAEYFYDEKINIGGYVATSSPGRIAQTTPDVQFFPEGGHW